MAQITLTESKKEELAQKYIDYICKRDGLDQESREAQVIYFAYMHGINQCLTELNSKENDIDKDPHIESTKDEQNPVWSDEDNATLDALIRRLEGEDIYISPHLAAECLKSIKERVQPQKEWSVEDRSKVQRICKYLNEAKKYYADITEVRECIEWLKALIPQNT